MQAVLDAVEGGEIQAVVVTKLDRLSRRVVDTLALVEGIEKAGAAFHSIAEKVDTKSAIGRFFLTICAAFAEMERGVIGERTAVALAHKQAVGEHVGAVPYGFRMDRRGGRLVPHEEEAGTVALVTELRSRGLTLQAIVEELTSQGVPTKRGGAWYPATVRKILARAGKEAA